MWNLVVHDPYAWVYLAFVAFLSVAILWDRLRHPRVGDRTGCPPRRR
jgi:hypothetical protein